MGWYALPHGLPPELYPGGQREHGLKLFLGGPDPPGSAPGYTLGYTFANTLTFNLEITPGIGL